MSAGTLNISILKEFRLGFHERSGVTLEGVDTEADERFATSCDFSHVKGMQRRRSRPGVDFAFDGHDPQIRKGDPFPPPNDGLDLFFHSNLADWLVYFAPSLIT